MAFDVRSPSTGLHAEAHADVLSLAIYLGDAVARDEIGFDEAVGALAEIANDVAGDVGLAVIRSCVSDLAAMPDAAPASELLSRASPTCRSHRQRRAGS